LPINHMKFLKDTSLLKEYLNSDILKSTVKDWAKKVGCTRQNYKKFFRELERNMWRLTYPQSEDSLIDDAVISAILTRPLGDLRPKFEELIGEGGFKSARESVGAMKAFVLFLIGFGLLDQVL